MDDLPPRTRSLVVLISGSGPFPLHLRCSSQLSLSRTGSNLQAIIDATLSTPPSLPSTRISLVISNRKAAYGLTRAKEANIPTDVLALKPYLTSHPGHTREQYDIALAERIRQEQPDLIVLAGFMHIVSNAFLNVLQNEETTSIPIINLHPALPGAFDGMNAIQRAHEAFEAGKIEKTGVMIHYVVAEVDRGAPVVVREVPIRKGETVEELEARIHAIEHQAIVEGVKTVLEGKQPV